MKLNLGCGQNKKAGYVNLGKYAACDPDVVWDLETFPWPFEDDSAEEIVLEHVLEHLGQSTETFLAIIKELYRIAAPGACLRIRVPHPRSDAFANDPTHVRPITPEMMTLFSKEKNREWKEHGRLNTPLGLYLDVDFAAESAEYFLTERWHALYSSGKLTPEQFNEAKESLFNVVAEVGLVLRAVKDRSAPVRG